MPILTDTDYNYFNTVPYPYIVGKLLSGSHENFFCGVSNYYWKWCVHGTFNVTIIEHLCKFNVAKSMTFIIETPYLHNCYAHLARNRNCSHKKKNLDMFKTTKKSHLDGFDMWSNTKITYIFFKWVPLNYCWFIVGPASQTVANIKTALVPRFLFASLLI